MRYKINLIGVGRGKATREIITAEEYGITEAEIRAVQEIQKHLMSRNVWISGAEGNEGTYGVYAGGRRVGKLTIEEV